jgi:hypothetical protein
MLKGPDFKIAIFSAIYWAPMAIHFSLAWIILLAIGAFALGYLCGQEKGDNDIRYCAGLIKRAGRDPDDDD